MSIASRNRDKCEELISFFDGQPLASVDEFLSRLDVEPDSFEALCAVQDYLTECRARLASLLLEQNGGEYVGMELTNHRDKNDVAAIFLEPSKRGRYRLSLYGVHGPSSHSVFDSPEKALSEAIQYGYWNRSPGSLDALTELESWDRGVKFTSLLQKTNGNPHAFLAANPGYLD